MPARGRNPWAIVTGVAALFLVLILGAIAIWAATKDDDKPQPDARRTTTTTTTTRTTPPTTTPTTTTPTTPTSAAQARLMSLLPPGFPPGSCTPDSQPMPGAVVSVKCGQNTDPNGPKVSAFGLYSDVAAVKKAFTAFIGTFTIQGCPGGKASPGTWWHNQDPKTVLGQIACGNYKGNEPQVMWSNEQTLMFGLAAGNPQTLDQLYKWWASHS
ncbi:histidine kinase [Mycobacterium szulgai]|nr:histidine kinase [Mycobacterium szulgai]